MSHDLIPAPVPPGTADIPGLAKAMDGSGPALLLVPPGPEGARMVATLAPLAAQGVPDGTAVVVATSGSTGTPKGVRISARALRHSARATHDFLGGPGQWLLAMSAARIAGLQVVLRSRAAGLEPAVLDTSDGFRPDAFAAALATMTGDRRYVSLVPTQLIRLQAVDVYNGSEYALRRQTDGYVTCSDTSLRQKITDSLCQCRLIAL